MRFVRRVARSGAVLMVAAATWAAPFGAAVADPGSGAIEEWVYDAGAASWGLWRWDAGAGRWVLVATQAAASQPSAPPPTPPPPVGSTDSPSSSTSTGSSLSSSTAPLTSPPGTGEASEGSPATGSPAAGGAALVTNEYAHFNAGSGAARMHPDWDVTSGSLFWTGQSWWTGVPDDRAPNAESSGGTNSAVFRAVTKHAFGDGQVRLKARVNALTTTPSTPAVAWDGVHLFVRYQNAQNLYYATVSRRDGVAVIKKKCPGGADAEESNGGTYYELASRPGLARIQPRAWFEASASSKANPDGSVTITLTRDGQSFTATDTGVGCPVITGQGATGVRADNADVEFADMGVAAS